jgi:hypothetical protein
MAVVRWLGGRLESAADAAIDELVSFLAPGLVAFVAALGFEVGVIGAVVVALVAVGAWKANRVLVVHERAREGLVRCV